MPIEIVLRANGKTDRSGRFGRFRILDDSRLEFVQFESETDLKPDGIFQNVITFIPRPGKVIFAIYKKGHQLFYILDRDVFLHSESKIFVFDIFFIPFFLLIIKCNKRYSFYFGLSPTEKNDVGMYDDIVDEISLLKKSDYFESF